LTAGTVFYFMASGLHDKILEECKDFEDNIFCGYSPHDGCFESCLTLEDYQIGYVISFVLGAGTGLLGMVPFYFLLKTACYFKAPERFVDTPLTSYSTVLREHANSMFGEYRRDGVNSPFTRLNHNTELKQILSCAVEEQQKLRELLPAISSDADDAEEDQPAPRKSCCAWFTSLFFKRKMQPALQAPLLADESQSLDNDALPLVTASRSSP